MTADFDPTTEATLDQLARFLPVSEREAGREAAVYAILMTESDLSPGTAEVAAWCYEFAAQGIAYHRWPDLVAARSGEPPQPRSKTGDALARARRDSLAQGLDDRGEI